ncbi:MAG: hypothetical protein IJ776_09150 [Paludibacteraceae bacterium]|nr:hypothetical protein [Paludibacteraceae bacterium]
MMNEISQKERLLQFLQHLGIGQNRFSKQAGISSGNIAHWRNGVIPPKSLEKIRMAYPELNVNWLLTGEGEMIKNNDSRPEKVEINTIFPVSDDFKQEVSRLQETLLIKDREIVELKQRIEELKDDKATLKHYIETLEDALQMLKEKTLPAHAIDAIAG